MKAVRKPAARAPSTGDVILKFFESVAGAHPGGTIFSGSLRFELKDGNRRESWRVRFTKGIVESVARSNARSDCVVHTDKATLEAIIEGRVDGMAALLRGVLSLEGEPLLLAVFRSLFGQHCTAA